MKKQIISFIAASLMLAAPCLNAGLANWISNHLPASKQVSQEYRDEVKYMKRKAGIRTPVIFVNVDDPSLNAAVWNMNFWSYPPLFSIMAINETAFKEATSLGLPAQNTQTLAHEIVHLNNNVCYFPHTNRAFKREEARAVKHSFAMLATLGYYKALEQQEKLYSTWGSLQSLNDHPHGKKYPTCGEYISWAQQALNNCHGIDPNDRPDSENLMRNGNIRLELDPRNMKS